MMKRILKLLSDAKILVRVILKTIHFLTMISSFLLIGFLIGIVVHNPERRRKAFVKNMNRHAKWGTKILGIKLIELNKPLADKPFLYVSNHYGNIDSILTAGLQEMMFVTSVENQKMPGVGIVMEMSSCIFVERRDRSNIETELKNMIDALQEGHCVAIFPESKAWNAEEILPFKRTLMQAAAYGGVPIQPTVINIKSVNKEEFTLKWRDHICWWGDMTFFPSIMKTFSLKEIEIEVEYLEPLYPTPNDDRRVVADNARERIVNKFKPVKK